MIRIKDTAGLQKEAAAQAERIRLEKEERLNRQRRLGPIRKAALWVTLQWWFSQLSLTLIVVFSVMLAFFDPTDPDNETPGNQFISKVEKIFIGIFTLEVVVVWLAEGLWGYFDEPWNTLDFFIVGVGYLSLTPVGANLGALRTIRLLRPLRSLKRIASMRRLVNSMLAALPGLVNVGSMIFAFIFVSSLFGVKMFKGIMKFGCVPTDGYDASVQRALMMADAECEKCMATCTAARSDVALDVMHCANVTGFALSNATACGQVSANGNHIDCIYRGPTPPSWKSLPFYDVMIEEYDLDTEEDSDAVAVLDASEQLQLFSLERLAKTEFWECAICQEPTMRADLEVPIRQRYGGRPFDPDFIGRRSELESCTVAEASFDPAIRAGIASAGGENELNAKKICLDAGNCDFSGGTGGVVAKCEPHQFRAKYMRKLTAAQLIKYLGIPQKVEEIDLRAYGLDQYEQVCNGFLNEDEVAAGYDTKCDPTQAPEPAFTALPWDGGTANRCQVQPRDCPCDCKEGYTCVEDGGPNYGISSFDHMGKAILSVFQIMTLEGWTELLDRLTDTSSDMLVIIYFVVIVWGGAFFLTHYMLAMICLEFSKKMKGTIMAEDAVADDADNTPQSVFKESVAPWGRMYRACTKACATDPAKLEAAKAKKLEAFVWCSASYRQLDETQRAQALIYLELPDIAGAADAAVTPQIQWPPQRISESQRWPDWNELKLEQQEAAIKLGMSQSSWPPKTPSVVQKFRLLLIKVSSLPIFDNFINSIIVVNFAMLAADRHQLDESVVETFESINGVLTNIFAAEMVIKQIGHGLGSYFADKFNCFDCFIVVTSLLEKMMDGGGSFSVLRTLRLLRILRSLKMMSGLDTLKKMIATTAGSMSAIANFAVLLLLLLYIFALVGMQMFGGKLEIEGETARPHFDNLIWSFTSVFLVMTRENWQALLYDTMYATGPAAVLYYYALIISTSYILLALFVGTLLENFEQFFLQGAREQKEKKDRIMGRKVLRNLFKRGKQSAPMVDEDVSEFASKWKKKSAAKASVGVNNSMAAFGVGTPNKYVANAGLGDGKASAEPVQPKSPPCKTLISPIRSVRKWARDFVENKYFEATVIFSILASSGCLAYEHPLDSPGSVKTSVLEVLDLAFIVFFTFEMAVKILAVGLIRGKESYLRSGWNILDGFIVSTSLIVLISDIDGGFFRIIRTVRVLRPLRAIQRSKGMRAVAGGLFKAVPSILTVAMLVFFFMLICAIFCVQMFKGTMYMCTDPTCASPDDTGGCDGPQYSGESIDAGEGQNCPIWSCTGTYIDPDSGSLMKSEWVNSQWNFDNVPSALLALFEIFALEAWPDILLALVDATDACHGPMKDSQVGVVWLFVIMIMFGAFFLLNLFVGVIVTAYNELQSEEEESEEEKSDRHEKRWHDDIVELTSYAQPQKLVYLDYTYRGPFMRITNARWFEPFVMFLIVLNVCVMGIDFADENGQTPPKLISVIEIINLFFTYSFTMEMLIKMISFYPRAYFCDPWNVFDFIITMVSLVETLFPLPLSPTLIRIFRIFRLARLLRLSKKAKGLKTLMKTFSATLPSLGHVGFLLMIFLFMYAVLGVQLFWNLQRQELVNDYTNFDDFGNAIYSLFRLSTGENWNGVMHECMIEEPDCSPAYCQKASMKVEVGEAWDGSQKTCESEGGQFVFSDCGTGAASFYHITFIVICAFTTLNLIIAVILFAFFDFSESDKKPTLGGDKIQTFEDAWARFDKNAEGELECSLIPKLLMANGIPLGVKKFDEAEALEQNLWDSELLFDYNGKIKFTEFLHAMVKCAYGVDCKAALIAKAEAKRRSLRAADTELLDASGQPVASEHENQDPDRPKTPSSNAGALAGASGKAIGSQPGDLQAHNVVIGAPESPRNALPDRSAVKTVPEAAAEAAPALTTAAADGGRAGATATPVAVAEP